MNYAEGPAVVDEYEGEHVVATPIVRPRVWTLYVRATPSNTRARHRGWMKVLDFHAESDAADALLERRASSLSDYEWKVAGP